MPGSSVPRAGHSVPAGQAGLRASREDCCWPVSIQNFVVVFGCVFFFFFRWAWGLGNPNVFWRRVILSFLIFLYRGYLLYFDRCLHIAWFFLCVSPKWFVLVWWNVLCNSANVDFSSPHCPSLWALWSMGITFYALDIFWPFIQLKSNRFSIYLHVLFLSFFLSTILMQPIFGMSLQPMKSYLTPKCIKLIVIIFYSALP